MTQQQTSNARLVAKANLFQLGDFTLHSGEGSRWKIECDALTGMDWVALAYMGLEKMGWPSIFMALLVPRGGLALTKALKPYESSEGTKLLLVDDVLTTGKSMEDLRHWANSHHGVELEDIIGLVAFARGRCPDWVTPIFQM